MRVLTDKELETQFTCDKKKHRRKNALHSTEYIEARLEYESTQRNHNIKLRKLETICYRTP